MTLDLRTLRHLVALSKRLNYARAAEDVGISQSALSRSIQGLERQLGMRLVDRDRSGVTLTPQGQTAVERAMALLNDAEDLEELLARHADGRAGRLCFGITPMPARALLPGALAERLREAPSMTSEVVVRDTGALWAMLMSGEIEFFVSQDGLLSDAPQARVEPLGDFPLCLVVRPAHPLLKSPDRTVRCPVVRSSWSGLPLPAALLPWLSGTPTIVEDFAALAAVTRATDAIWFSSVFAVLDELESGALHELVLPGAEQLPQVRIAVVTHVRRSQSPLADAMKQALRRTARTLARRYGARP